VRNRHDGAVEAVFEGPRERIESMLRWCERGPAAAHVEDVDVEWLAPEGEGRFVVR
jgi:acylphosphatase